MNLSKQTIIWASILVVVALGFGLYIHLAVNSIVDKTKAESTPVPTQAQQISAYRKAMRDGAAIAAIHNATTICASLKCSPKDLQEMKLLMGSVAMAKVDSLNDDFILAMMNMPDKTVQPSASPSPTPTPKGEISA